MKFQLISDLHLECYHDEGLSFVNKDVPVLADTIVLAGDVMNLTGAKDVIETLGWFCDRWKHVLYVPGNHEYYLTSPNEGNKRLEKAARWFSTRENNLHVLNPGTIEVEGQRFVGATMWFPPTPDEDQYRKWLSDFRLIHNFVPWVHEEHARHMDFLRQTVLPTDVVVTHHMPDPQSTPAKFATSRINRFFVAPDAADIIALGPKMWLHGHTHTACEYTVGSTHVICNPRGYPGEKGASFDIAKVIDV